MITLRTAFCHRDLTSTKSLEGVKIAELQRGAKERTTEECAGAAAALIAIQGSSSLLSSPLSPFSFSYLFEIGGAAAAIAVDGLSLLRNELFFSKGILSPHVVHFHS